MASAEGDEGTSRMPDASAGPPKLDRRAEALRANLKRRKAQTRAREGLSAVLRAPELPGRDG